MNIIIVVNTLVTIIISGYGHQDNIGKHESFKFDFSFFLTL